MSNEISLKMVEIVGSKKCVIASDGQKVYDYIVEILDRKLNCKLSFFSVEYLTASFLNTAIGQLFGKYQWNFLHDHFFVVDISSDDLILLERVINNAKKYFRDKYLFDTL